MNKLILCAAPLLLASLPVSAHPGTLDAYGCHHEYARDNYHCHSGEFSGRTFPTKDAMLQELELLHPGTNALIYNRDDYLPNWADFDGDCRNTRVEVLLEELLAPPRYGNGNCTIISAAWYDPFTPFYTNNASDLSIDHLVPLKEAHISGAAYWSKEKKRAYANDITDPRVLIAVRDDTNQNKSDKDPAHWLPPNAAYHCQYIKDWVGVKDLYDLSIDAEEQAAIDAVLAPGASGLPVETGSWQFDKEHPGITANAVFSFGLEHEGACGYFDTASVGNTVAITGTIKPDPAHIGRVVDIYLVDRVDMAFTMRTESGAYIPWNGRVPDLVPAQRSVVLTGLEQAEAFRGTLGVPGEHRLFLGYTLDGKLYYSPNPMIMDITP